MRGLGIFSGCGWAYGFILSLLPPQMLPQICESWLKSYLMQVCKSCHYTLVEVVEPFKLHPTSRSYIYKVYEYLLRLWMGIWLHTHTITTTEASPVLWEFGKCANHATMLWLRLQNLSNCILCPYHTCMRCLSTFSGCGWAYGFTVTPLPPQMLP